MLARLSFRLFILITLFVSNATNAANLCDTSCSFQIDFIDGGSIKAIETVTITFGEGGVINTGSVVTAYSTNEILVLNSGTTLMFEAGGFFDLGLAGNIDFSEMEIVVAGDITVADSNAGDVSIHGDSTIEVSGTLTLNSDLNLLGDLILPSSSTELLGTGGVTINTSGSLVLNDSKVLLQSSYLNLEAINNELSGTTAVFNPSNALTQDDLVNLSGVTLKVDDETSCVVRESACFDLDDNIYVVEDGRLVLYSETVEDDDATGSFDQILYLIFALFLFSRIKRRVY